MLRRQRFTWAGATDAQLVLFLAWVSFALAAWPLLLVDVPPLQDLPNHLATESILENPGRYPEFFFNGFFKTNAALFTWLFVVGRWVGPNLAARLFVALVLLLEAVALPLFVLSFGGRRKMVTSAFFSWPMVHNWFVSMGMLDFALGVPLATLLLVGLRAQLERPSPVRGWVLAATALLTWYAHVFPLLVVCLLVGLHFVDPGARPHLRARVLSLGLPLAPAASLSAASLFGHFTEPVGAMAGYADLGRFLPPWELAYNLWAEWFWGFTRLEIATLVPCVSLALWALYRRRDAVTFFGAWPFAVLGALFVSMPYVTTNWFHVNSRLIPFLWLAALARVPERLPKPAYAALAVCAASYSMGMGVDYRRLCREWQDFTAGIGAVPDGARLLPLVFRSKETSENTRSLLHAWGFYVVEKHASAPLLFAHSRSFPLMYRHPPVSQLNHLVLEGFAPSMSSPESLCRVMRSGGVVPADCSALWTEQWASFWRVASPEFDHVLTWAAPERVEELVPPEYALAFRRGSLRIFSRRSSPAK